MSLPTDIDQRTLIADMRRLFACLSRKRKLQLGGLFLLQMTSALSEVVSLGAVVPFLTALTSTEKLIANPYSGPLIARLGITDSGHLIILMASLFATAIVVANALRYMTLRCESYLTASIGTDLGRELFQKMLYRPYSYFVRTNSSQLIAKMTSDLSGTLGAIQSTLAIITQALLTLAIVAGLLAYNAPVALALSSVTIIAFSVIMIAIRRRLNRNSAAISDNYRNIIRVLQEGFGGIRHIALDRTQDSFIDRYHEADLPYRYKSSENLLLRQAPRFFIEAVGVVMISGLTIYFVAQNRTVSDIIPLMGFLALGCMRLLPATQQVYAALGAIFALKTPLHRTMEILGLPLTIPPSRTLPPLPLAKSLELKDLFFSYTDDPGDWTLKGINLSVKAKTTVALVGSTGSGKSTLSDLILGLITAQSGTIRVDGTEITAENIGAWQNGIAHVPQHIFLMDCSIAENIAFGLKMADIDMERVREAARLAKIDTFIETLPEKYLQTVGERGVRLSGGQLQRIGIARALYNKPSLILFDEATSALDNRTEQEVMSSIEGLGHELTVILIAHRLSTVRKADEIFVLDHGTLVAQGSYDDLMDNSPHFRRMIQDMADDKAQAA